MFLFLIKWMFIAVVFAAVIVAIMSKLSGQTIAEGFAEAFEDSGILHPEVICPHCQTKGQVRFVDEKVKAGISGGKAAAAVITGGVSLAATGLSRKTTVTRATCGHCHVSWHI